jgi:hypothetical protein
MRYGVSRRGEYNFVLMDIHREDLQPDDTAEQTDHR